MEGQASYKVPGGKLLNAKVSFDKKIKKVQLTGDFFAYPEEGILWIESALVGIDSDGKQILQKASEAIGAGKIELIGIDAAAIARVVKEAMKA